MPDIGKSSPCFEYVLLRRTQSRDRRCIMLTSRSLASRDMGVSRFSMQCPIGHVDLFAQTCAFISPRPQSTFVFQTHLALEED